MQKFFAHEKLACEIYYVYGTLPIGMLSPCYSTMSSELFEELPSSTNAVESYNRFGRPAQRQPLKLAMMTTYKEDMAKTLEIMARRKSLSTNYDSPSLANRSKRSAQQCKARRKRLRTTEDDAKGPPDTKKSFVGKSISRMCHLTLPVHCVNDLNLNKLQIHVLYCSTHRQ